jgi:hypothetical protein
MQFPSQAGFPLVIGATGGSGTRVLAKIAQRAGYFVGHDLNPAQDALAFVWFHDKWINRYYPTIRGESVLTPDEQKEMRVDFQAALGRNFRLEVLRFAEPGYRWGWKAPRSIYLLPFFHELMPGMKFIQVLRDGRDMAFSKNQNQLRKNGRSVLTLSERWLLPLPVRSLTLWDRVNQRAADYGEQKLGPNFLQIRFEDLCQDSAATVARILQFIGSPDLDAEEIAKAEIAPPSSIGRWRTNPQSSNPRFQNCAKQALLRFGYDDQAAR